MILVEAPPAKPGTVPDARDERLTESITVGMTAAEEARIELKATAAGMSKSAWCRFHLVQASR